MTGVGNYIFWSEIGSEVGELGGTPPPIILQNSRVFWNPSVDPLRSSTFFTFLKLSADKLPVGMIAGSSLFFQ